MYHPPDKPLIVKCTFDKWHKRITFSSARNCSYELLRNKIEQCFSLYATSYAVSYKDDDGEITVISTDADLTEAIQYFQAGDDAPLSSAASILSGRSFGPRKITLRVDISVDYDGPSLSDTSSLASIEEFKGKNGSQHSFSFGTPSIQELDDDSVTVSSRDPGTSSRRNGRFLGDSLYSQRVISRQGSFTSSDNRQTSVGRQGQPPQGEATPSRDPGSDSRHDGYTSSVEDSQPTPAPGFAENSSAVFERLKLSETLRDDTSSIDFDSLAASERGAAWLRDQEERAIRARLGALPEPSESDGSFSLTSSEELSLEGDLALERDPRGRYYYTYTSGSSSQFQESGDDDGLNGAQEGEGGPYGEDVTRGPRPTSMQLRWIDSQRKGPQDVWKTNRHSDLRSLSIQEEDNILPQTIDKELLPFLPVPPPSSDILTDCSNCGIILDAIRYVCSTCGEKAPMSNSGSGKGKYREESSSPVSTFSYPPPGHTLFSSPNSSSSQTFVGSPESLNEPQRYKPLPSIPSAHSLPSLPSIFGGSRPRSNAPSSPSSSVAPGGYELCSACIESVGIHHAIEAGLAGSSSSPGVGNMSPSYDDPQRALQWRRAAPRKGQLRHAYQEKVWGHLGWEDVVLDEAQISQCSTCSAVTERQRYKCASCNKMHLCRACYSQVHELHPSHAFLIVPDKPAEVSESDSTEHPMPHTNEENSLIHPGVKCAHCLLDIVGARFHCAICDAVDICSNCESAGLPGNLDSADGGHNSSHILIKIPYPLETAELQNASRRALHLWTGRDAASVGFKPLMSKAESEISSYAQTMIVSGSRNGLQYPPDTHRLFCNNCGDLIIGVRYQCGHCQSKPYAYNLCSNCERNSYEIHDPMHVFFKLPRPVHRALESLFPMLPPLYKSPAGPARGENPRAFLASLVHTTALCDRCINTIRGEWFRCAYCARDLCDACEAVDTHDDTHVFLVLKSAVDMQLFNRIANTEDTSASAPIISYPVYR
ncbi:hypothetical protein CPC08DRAFT_801895 [Agrocybe pediades]|nr:hypothetical protein CPC08DRAFT_801895 [Agrocybe pediades]